VALLRVIIKGKSMKPSYKEGDILRVKKVGVEAIKEGNVIIFKSPDMKASAVHRVIALDDQHGQRSYITQGDNAERPDGIVHPKWIIGKVVGKYEGKRLVPASRFEELFWLKYAGLYRKALPAVCRVIRLGMPVVYSTFLARIFPVKKVRIGERRLGVVFGRVVAIEHDTPEGVNLWVHPLLGRVKGFKLD
jgi:hypothetical protein